MPVCKDPSLPCLTEFGDNVITLPLLVTGLIYNGVVGGAVGVLESGLGILFGFGILIGFYILGGIGSGDVKLGTPSSYLFQGVKVLAVGQSLGQPVAAAPAADGAEATATTAPPVASPLITVQLPPDQAQLLISVRDASLYLTLNRPDYQPVPVPFTDSLPALPGELGVSPYAAQGATGQ